MSTILRSFYFAEYEILTAVLAQRSTFNSRPGQTRRNTGGGTLIFHHVQHCISSHMVAHQLVVSNSPVDDRLALHPRVLHASCSHFQFNI